MEQNGASFLLQEQKLIDANALKEKILTLTLTVTGLRYGKGVLLELLNKYRNGILQLVDEQPTVDAVEVVHSFWDDSGRYVFPSGRKAICCDVCKCALSVGEYNRFKWNYCPVCGAKMDGDGNG